MGSRILSRRERLHTEFPPVRLNSLGGRGTLGTRGTLVLRPRGFSDLRSWRMTSGSANPKQDLCCPFCLGSLRQLDGAYGCVRCDRQFPVPHGIPCLTERPDTDAGEIGQAGMRRLLEDCERFPWQQAVERVVSTLARPSRFLEEAVSPCRASWWPLTSLQAHWRVLDFGCGWGAMTFGLAPHVASVLACDLNLDRLRFVQARALQDGVGNVGLVCAGDTPRLPFADHEFHAILFQGALGRPHTGSPASVLESFLCEAARLLMPDGQVWLWVPNRWSWRRWRGEGANDPKRAWITLLTGLATRADKSHLADSCSLWSYKHLLRSAGFVQNKGLVPLPDLDSFHAIIDPSASQTTELYFADRSDAPPGTFYLKAKSALTPLLSPGFLCIASRGEEQASFLDQLGRHIGGRLYGEASQRIACIKYRVTRREVITCELKINGRASFIVKIPLSPAAVGRIRGEQETLRTAHQLLVRSGEWPEIPKPMLEGEFRAISYHVQEALPGLSGLRVLSSRSLRHNWRALALDFIVRFHLATQVHATLNEAAWDDWVMPLLYPALRITQERAGVPSAYLRDILMRALVGQRVALVFRHGDFWPGNLLFDKEARHLTGVIDWDRGEPRSLPLLDLLDALISGRAEEEQTPTPMLIGTVLRSGLQREDRQIVELYLQKMGLTLGVDQLKAFLLLDWLLRVSARASPRHSAWWCEYEWLRENVAASAPWLRDALGLSRAGPAT